MKKANRTFLTLALMALATSLVLTACQKPEEPSGDTDQPTNAEPATPSEHPEHPQ